MGGAEATAERLVELGFSRYEARAYLGLIGTEPQTGYALANTTGIPQPKVYETLRKLVARNAVVKIGSDPARFVALAPEQLLGQLESDFRRRLTDAKLELERFDPARPGQEVRLFHSAQDRATIVTTAQDLLSKAEEHVYLAGSSEELAELGPGVAAAQDRGVRFDVLHFGRPPFAISNGRLLAHASTDGVLFRHHQARYLALVADGSTALWSLAPGGADWQGQWLADALFAALVKGYIRHDLYVQQIYADLPEPLTERYGPGLNGLIAPSARPSEPQHDDAGTRRLRAR